MATAPDPEEIYDRAKTEGRRRLQMPALEEATTGFIAGVTVMFGIVALGVVYAYLEPHFGPEVAKLGGAFAFGVGLVFLIVGRSELFSENFFDPVAAAIGEGGTSVLGRLARLWVLTLAFNLVGGAVLGGVMTVEGALPHGAAEALITAAEELAHKSWAATLARAVLAGALVTLLSFMLSACNTVAARILVAYMVGVVLALGPFDHVVVSVLHILMGVWLGGVAAGALVHNLLVATAGNLLGGLLLMTFTHTAQAKSAESS